jgi:steroid delta-isomerase-like uncharacterized protein
MATQQDQELVKRFFDEVCNQQKLQVADVLFSNTHIYHDPQTPAAPGPDGMKEVIRTYQEAFAGATWHLIETIVADNDIITRWKGSGTHRKELNGIPPTGKNVTVDGIWIHRVKNGKIEESWNVWDTLGLLQQLGVVPAMQREDETAMASRN